MPGEKDELKKSEKAPPAKQPTQREGQDDLDQGRSSEKRIPGADGPLDADAEEDTYD